MTITNPQLVKTVTALVLAALLIGVVDPWLIYVAQGELLGASALTVFTACWAVVSTAVAIMCLRYCLKDEEKS
jgi:hypothetical protein